MLLRKIQPEFATSFLGCKPLKNGKYGKLFYLTLTLQLMPGR